MRISVIIPCYNAEPYLAQTIGSVLDQSRPPDEVIIVDDGSTDGSLAIARRFEAACGEQVRVHSERSGQAARTRNIGASLATGDALMFLDADDILAPNNLESLLNSLNARPGGMAACPWRRLKLVGGKWLSRPASCASRQPHQDALAAWMTGWYYPPCAVLWSKEAFLYTGGWDERPDITVNDDGDLMMRALTLGIALEEIGAGVAYYRTIPEGQVSLSGRRYSYEGLASRMLVIEKIAHALEDQGSVDMYRSSISQAFSMLASDAAWHYFGICEKARKKSREYAPSFRTRSNVLNIHAQRQPFLERPKVASPDEEDKEIHYGRERAEYVMASTPEVPKKAKSISSQPNTGPSVSVIIPVYNRAHLLRRTLGSVLAQTFTNFEVLVVDDGSKDDPASVVLSLQDPRLRYVPQPKNLGVAAARNRGLREARGPLVAFLDDDDEWFPEKLALQVELFQLSPADVGLIYTGVETVSENGNRTHQTASAGGYLYREMLVKNVLHGGSSNIMMRRNIIADIGFFDESLPAIEDYDYWLRVCRRYKVDYIALPLIRYHDPSTSAVTDVTGRRSRQIKANIKARELFYQKHGKQMRKEGLAHLFLHISAHRHLKPEWNDVNAARRLAMQAFFIAPTSWHVRDMIQRLFIPRNIRRFIRKVRNL